MNRRGWQLRLTTLLRPFGSLAKTSSAKNAGWLYLLQFSNYVIPLVTVPYLVRVLGPSSYGEVGFGQGLASYLAIGVNYGFDLSATRDISSVRSNALEVKRISSAIWTAKLTLLILALGLLTALIVFVGKVGKEYAIMLILFGIVIGNALFPTWLFQGLERMGFISVTHLVTRAAATAAIFVFVRSSNNALQYAVILSSQWLLMGLVGVALATLRLGVYPSIAPWNQVRRAIIRGGAAFSARALGGVYSAGNPFLLGLLSSPSTVGYYVAAEKLVRVAVGSLDPLTQALYPSFSRHAVGLNDDFNRTFRWVSKVMVAWGAALGFFFLVGGHSLVKILYGVRFESSVVPLEVLGSECLFVAVSYCYGVLYMLPMRKDAAFSGFIAVATAIDIVLALILVPKLGATGMAISVVASEAIVALATYFYAKVHMGRVREASIEVT